MKSTGFKSLSTLRLVRFCQHQHTQVVPKPLKRATHMLAIQRKEQNKGLSIAYGVISITGNHDLDNCNQYDRTNVACTDHAVV